LENPVENIGKKIIEARKRAGVTAADLSKKVGLSPASISAYENAALKGGPDSEVLIRIADALNAPEILLHHCEYCSVRRHVFLRYFPELNNINTDPAVIAARLRKEMVEAADALDRLGERFSDRDFKSRPDYLETFVREMEQVVDVKRGIEILEFELMLSGLHTREDLQAVYDQQHRKCVRNGHHKRDVA
jgi:transcriptional regulator with XRE-family HTH domain